MATLGLTARTAAGTQADLLSPDLFPDAPSVVDWGLERMETALAELGDPHRRYRCLHVGGTNGKGSVASTWSSVLQSCGERTGLYTSPHLCSITERVMVDGRPLAADRLARTAADLRPLTSRLGMSFFEATTLMALLAFAEEEVESACIEVGLGGRLDATNVVEPAVTVITNVALDHQEHLGDSLEEIAGEKAGIIKAGAPCVVPAGSPGVMRVLAGRARAVGAPFHVVDPAREITDLELGPHGARFTLRTPGYERLRVATPLPGSHQAVNAALAIRALELLPDPPPARRVLEGVAGVRWPGRGQIRQHRGRRFVFDVAHNVAAARALAGLLEVLSPPRPLVLLAGILGDKDWSRMLPPLVDAADRAVFTIPASAPRDRTWDPREVMAGLPREAGGAAGAEVVDDVAGALERAMELAGAGTVVVTGSCHTVGDALLTLGASPFADAGDSG